MLSVADEAGNKDTLGIHTRTLLRRVGRRDDMLRWVSFIASTETPAG
jgi:hypothetical protein